MNRTGKDKHLRYGGPVALAVCRLWVTDPISPLFSLCDLYVSVVIKWQLPIILIDVVNPVFYGRLKQLKIYLRPSKTMRAEEIVYFQKKGFRIFFLR